MHLVAHHPAGISTLEIVAFRLCSRRVGRLYTAFYVAHRRKLFPGGKQDARATKSVNVSSSERAVE